MSSVDTMMASRVHRLVASVIITLLLAHYVNGGSSFETTVYKTCEQRKLTGSVIGTTSAVSEIDCARQCKSEHDCASAIFTRDSSLNNCHMTTHVDNWESCDSYYEDLASTIMFPVKVCLNGGKWEVNKTCTCPEGFKGQVCQDRDCTGNYTYDPVSGVCYIFVAIEQDYDEAKLDCESVPGRHLLSDITLLLLNRLIAEIKASQVLSSTAAFYVDGRGDNTDYSWNRWDGQPLVYPPDVWDKSQPNSAVGQKHCIFMASGQEYKLNDLACTKHVYHICQLDG